MEIICFDTETTGLHENEDDILQLSIVDGAGKALYNGYFNPERRSEWPEAEKINHISPDMVKDCPTFAQEKEKIQAIFDRADTLIGYNVGFDMKFLAAAGIDFSRFQNNQIVDVMKDFAPIYGERSDSVRSSNGYKWKSLSVCAEHYGFDWSDVPAHNSLGDCLATIHCYNAMQQERLIQEKINLIAPTFGATSGQIEVWSCGGRWQGTSDVSIVFDNGERFSIGNDATPNAKKFSVRNKMVDDALAKFNPKTVAAMKDAALKALREREAKDNAIAAEKGLKPYKVLTVEISDFYSSLVRHHLSNLMDYQYYVTLAVDGKIHALLKPGLHFDVENGRVTERSNITKDAYSIDGELMEKDVDFVFGNVGCSTLKSTHDFMLTGEVRKRVEKALSERLATEQQNNRPQEWEKSSVLGKLNRAKQKVAVGRTDAPAAGKSKDDPAL